MTKLNKTAYDAFAGTDWPIYDDYINDKNMTDAIKEELDTLEKDAAKINIGYEYLSKVPLKGNFNRMSSDYQYKLTESKNFCMMPWIHMHAFPDGRAYPCCLADYWHPIGDLRKNTMEEVWNQSGYKTMRLNMLQDKPSVQCTKCYEQEKNGFFSMRNDANRTYGHLVDEISLTKEDGTHPEFKIRYWDVRFSNLCNFSCRSCGPIFSSNWYNDHVKLYNRKPDVLGRDMLRVEYTAGDEDAMLEQMLPHIPHLEQVYFAGGEPLIMKEHYFLLEKLIEYGKTDIRILYNTNFSELRYKDKHVFDYWKHFKNVSVGASLDASGSRAELMRKGTDWSQTLENRRRMMVEVPHVDFYISATVSAMNVLHVLDFHREWTDLGLIEAKDFNVNICQNAKWYRTDIFPKWFKDKIITPAYKNHIAWLEPQDDLNRATNGFKSALVFINATDNSDEWSQFIKETANLDRIRNESFWDTFPEIKQALDTQKYE
ncbi:4Fe4S-binding SPASM domain containing protein [uncultured Caudovirales phage]|uniref:4Fe4S-binding SPASM domain containing protein n=1 Tax=uncultured Caudovirales phage TaxID=2100421 RepID=A0A6J5LPS1_9CAUD|nr:4Fe4S-binding SPASM domain containing protein [uncultured Caudovirales phage]